MLLGNGSSKPAQGSSVSVDNVKLSVHLTLVLDGILNLRICKDLIIQTRPIGVHLRQQHTDVSTDIFWCLEAAAAAAAAAKIGHPVHALHAETLLS